MVHDEKEDYLNWEKKQNSRWTKISQQVKAVHVLLIVGLIFFAVYMYNTKKLSREAILAIVVPFGILILFLMYRETSTPKLIPEHIIKQIAQDALERKRTIGIEIPFDCKVRVTLVGEGIYETDMYTGTSGIIKRDVGFEVIKHGLRKTGVIGIHPYNGTILGLRWMRLGYSGTESKDRQIIPVGFIERPKPSTSI